MGAAAGGALWVLAVATTGAYFLVVFGYPAIMRRIPASPQAPSGLRLRYADGRGLLRHVLGVCTGRGFAVADIAVDRSDTQSGLVAVALEIQGRGHVADLAGELGEIDGVVSVSAGDVNEVFD